MAKVERNASRRDYLARLTGLALGHTQDHPPHTDHPAAVLRPRLPSRFEAASEVAGEAASWDEAEDESALAASAPHSPAARRFEVEPQPEPRRSREGDPDRPPPPVTPPIRLAGEPSTFKREPPDSVKPTKPTAAPPLRPQAALVQPEPPPQAQTDTAAEARSKPGDRSIHPTEAATGFSSSPAPRTASEAAAPARLKPPAPRPMLRPAPTPPELGGDEGGQARFTGKSRGPRSEAGPVSAAERRSEPTPPVINVTIGRIEIRAPALPSAPPPPPPEPPRPAVSLDEYLQRRADGRY